jgi:hypothetical protein
VIGERLDRSAEDVVGAQARPSGRDQQLIAVEG